MNARKCLPNKSWCHVSQKLLTFSHDLSMALVPQTLEGFNDLGMKAHDIEIHLNKHKNGARNNKEAYPAVSSSA